MINKGYRQGIFRPRNSAKCKSTSCVYRSALELKLMRNFDSNPNIISWGSENIVIPYIKPTDGKVHRYYVDFSFKIRDKNGIIHNYIAELKPKKQCIAPINHGNKKPSTIFYEKVTYAVNTCKWEAGKQWAEKHNTKFIIITEDDIEKFQ